MKRRLLPLLTALLFLILLPQGASAEQPENHRTPLGYEVVQANAAVMFNTNSGKFHPPRCEWAIKYTRNCIRIPGRKP